MDWTALTLSLKLAAATALALLPVAVGLGHALAWRRFRGKSALEAIVALPLVLPPTVLGYYLLVTFAPTSGWGASTSSSWGRRSRSASRVCWSPR